MVRLRAAGDGIDRTLTACKIRVGQLELHKRGADQAAHSAIGFQLRKPACRCRAFRIAVDIAQGQRVACLGAEKEHTIRIALPDPFVLPAFKKRADLRRTGGNQIIQRDRDRAARGFGNFIGMSLKHGLQILRLCRSHDAHPKEEH